MADRKLRVKMVVSMTMNSPIVGPTSASVIATIADQAIKDRYDLVQTCIIGNTEYESIVRGISMSPDEKLGPAAWSEKAAVSRSIADNLDVIVVVRNGVSFKPDDVIKVVDAAMADPKSICAAVTTISQIYGHGKFEGDTLVARPVSAGVGTDPEYVTMALAAAAPCAWFDGSGTEFDAVDTYTLVDGGLVWTPFDVRLSRFNAHKLVEDAVVSFSSQYDVHTAFHTLIESERVRSQRLDPEAVKINVAELFAPYLAACKSMNAAEMHAAGTPVVMSLLEVIQKLGVSVDMSGIGIDELALLSSAQAKPVDSDKTVEFPQS